MRFATDLLPQPVPHHTEAPAGHHQEEETHEAADDVDDGHGGGDTPAGQKVSLITLISALPCRNSWF